MCKRLICLTCCILVLGLATGASADLLVHYKLDETSGTVAADASGNGFDGTINGLPNWVEGNLGGALEFLGTENVTLPADVMGLTSVIGSVAFWMNAGVPSGINTMFWAGDNTTGGGFGPENEMHVHLEAEVGGTWIGGELSFYIRADPNPNVHLHSDPEKGGADAPGNTPVNPILMGDNLWHHVAGTWDGNAGTAKLFIDGLLIMEWPYEPNPYELTNIFLGQMANASRTYTGMLDDVRIYSNALSDEEVYFLYENLDVDVNDSPVAKPQEFILNQNYPNPFNPVTNIEFTLANPGHTTLEIYNMLGQLVETLVDRQMSRGNHLISFRADKYKSGVYFYKLRSGNFTQVKKMMFLK